ncbi:O-methyltransferase [Lentibacillus amyloliquefaciens]|uniref:tRNA 5-hydroxyuridine methyltransferase n=1 Tax=Lentibacillus amyloliquefaciens TaxID=1472767 RepID=A0A0U4E5J2_9BACI|nr:O-methyltransferase [Lentibacillus amyloliquefaciens]ALX48161.1 SAM-dependent methyltransferase [Lentibacillus amyloliquefaciens]
MDETLANYLRNSLPDNKTWVTELEQAAEMDNVPIMDPISMNFVMQMIRLIKPDQILEIGTAIGYSALRMLEAYPAAQIVTIERDENRYHKANNNIRRLDKQGHITTLFGDAIEQLQQMQSRAFDLILIDAAKGKYQRFFEHAAPLLVNGGTVLSDNVLFKGYVADDGKQHPRYQKIAKKIRTYNDWLTNHPDFATTIVPIGDGIAMSIKDEGKEFPSND